MPNKTHLVIWKRADLNTVIEEYGFTAYPCSEFSSEEKAQSYARDWATRNPGQEVWVGTHKSVYYTPAGELIIRSYNDKGELLPV